MVARKINQSRLGAELSDTQREGSEETFGDLRAARDESFGKHEERIGGAHLREAGNRLRARRGHLHQRPAGRQGAGEADGLYLGMLDQRRANLRAGAEEQREDSRRQAALFCAVANDLCNQFTGAGMRRMSLDDDRIARGERGSRISAGDRKGERKVARSKDNDRAKRTQQRAQIGPWQGRAIGLRWVDAGIDPRAFFGKLRKEPELVCGSRQLSLKTLFRQGRLAMRAFHQLHRNAFDSPCDVAKKPALFLAGMLAVYREGFPGQCCRQVNVLQRSGMEGRNEASSSRGIEARKLLSGSLSRLAIQK